MDGRELEGRTDGRKEGRKEGREKSHNNIKRKGKVRGEKHILYKYKMRYTYSRYLTMAKEESFYFYTSDSTGKSLNIT